MLFNICLQKLRTQSKVGKLLLNYSYFLLQTCKTSFRCALKL